MSKYKYLNPKSVIREFNKRAKERIGLIKVLSDRFGIATNDEFDYTCNTLIKKYFPHELKNVVDAGIGIGRLTKHFSEISGKVIGIDFSKEILTLATKYLKDKKNVTLLLSDIKDVDFLPNYFDLGIVSLILKHNNDQNTIKIIDKLKKWCQSILLIEHISGGDSGSNISIIRKESWYLKKFRPMKPAVKLKFKRHKDIILFCIFKKL